MYLAHRLVTLGHEYRGRFPAVLQSHTSTFIDQVTVLRELGTSVFLKFMQGQRKQILDILRDSGEIHFSYIHVTPRWPVPYLPHMKQLSYLNS
jgi:hypothetical protein